MREDYLNQTDCGKYFILCPCIDGLPTPLWKLQAVRDAVELYGQK